MGSLKLPVVATFIIGAALVRLLPHPWNVTPIAAMALFAGAHMGRRWVAFAIPLGALFVSDVVLGFHATMPFTYGAFAAIVLIGGWLQGRMGWQSTALAAVAGSFLFFLVTNLGSWVTMPVYPKTPAGLVACYTAALPFFRNTMTGDLFYVAILFGGAAALRRLWPGAAVAPVSLSGAGR